MGLATGGLEWLVLGASHELMLFASVGILLIGLDDLLFDAMWLATRRETSAARPRARPPLAGTLAIFVPAWDEAEVLPAMLRRTLAAWEGEDFRVYLGCYPNDSATLFAISPLVARDQRLRLVIGERPGPTTKGDNLNRLWSALANDERREDRRFAGVVFHDAEDHVHRDELALYRAHLSDHAMVQIPVVPLFGSGSCWVSGHYGDEFAEAHGKDLALRSRLRLPIPSAGVGCALSRDAMALLALHRGGQPFRADSLTEDYEVGMLVGAYGLRSIFVDSRDGSGNRIASHGPFPDSFDAAVRQKARWVAGIALAGWDHLGWQGPPQAAAGRPDGRTWLARWLLWRDRRAPLAAIVTLAAYAAFLATLFGAAGHAAMGWRGIVLDDAMRLLIGLNLVLLLWRLGIRSHFTTRFHGLRQGMLAIPRAFVGNVIAILAARRAVVQYCQMLRTGTVVWDKTRHVEPGTATATALASAHRQ